MKAKLWLIGWLVIVITVLGIIGAWVYRVDPFFHYHRPDTQKYFYTLNNQRSQNDGIVKHFEYDALITGTSMTENFKASEADRFFGCNAVKVCFAGARYKEVNDLIETALKANPDLKIVIRCLDMQERYTITGLNDSLRTDLGEYPTYLYDNNPFNDINYLLNRDIVFGRVYEMELETEKEGFEPGITSFDNYSRWQRWSSFGIETAAPKGITDKKPAAEKHLTEKEKTIIKKNIEATVIRTADNHPDVDFYYYYSPYSIIAWSNWKNEGELYKHLETEAYITELIVPHKNIHLFSFFNRTDIITDLNNYKDDWHYAGWINTLILKWMCEDRYRLTEDNYRAYLEEEYAFYTTFDYASVNGQEDYEADDYAAALLNKDLTGAEPLDVLNDPGLEVEISGAEYVLENGRNIAVDCHGALARNNATQPLVEYLRDTEFIGIKIQADLDEGYNYLSFIGQKIRDQGRLTAYVYNENGELVKKLWKDYSELDSKPHSYVLDLSDLSGTVTVVLNGGYIHKGGSADSEYRFSDVFLY